MYNYYNHKTKVKYVINNDFKSVSNKAEINLLREQLKNKLRQINYPITNLSTKKVGIINRKSINKMLYPAPVFNPFAEDYILQLNALFKLKELFEQAIYIDTYYDMKKNFSLIKYHYFVAPLIMKQRKYRVLITVKDNNSQNLQILTLQLELLKKYCFFPISKIKIKYLINNTKLYNYQINAYEYYDLDKLLEKNVIKEDEVLYVG